VSWWLHMTDDENRGGASHSAKASASAPQGGGDGVRGPLTAAPGGSVTVNVGPNDAEIKVVDGSTGNSSTRSVTPGKDTEVTIPNVPGGTWVSIEIGTGLNKRVLLIEVIAPGP
jgi:hypothetical protein